MLKLAKRSAKKLRDFALSLLFPKGGQQGADPTVVDPLIIKAQIPRSHFTRKGPGVSKDALRVFAGFTGAQQDYACVRGWFPEAWAPIRKKRDGKTLFIKIIASSKVPRAGKSR